jgi:uncharacterized protein
VKLIIPGGSGQVGTILARNFHRDGHEVVVLSRRPSASPWRVIHWDAQNLGDWVEEFRGADAIINLAGRSVNCRYGTKNRVEILESRVQSTRVVGKAIASVEPPPKVWLQASTATIYAHRYDAPNDERNGILGGNETRAPDTWRFSIDVAKAWEAAVDDTPTPRTRKVMLRSAMIMSPERGGIFDTLLMLVRRGLGGKAADGQQYVSWIHEEDFIRAVSWLTEHDEVQGPINVASPNPLPNREFMRVLREASGIRFGLPATKWMLGLAAVFMRTETELILKSRRVIPGILLERGFSFRFPTWPEAAADLCQRWKSSSGQVALGAADP